MDFIVNIYQFITHLDVHLQQLTLSYGQGIYLLLFLIIFAETGFVVTPFFPGDSLLFAAGSVAALGGLNIHFLFVLLFFAAVAGDNFNYFIGYRFGRQLFQSPNSRIFNKKHLDTAHAFYEKHGPKAIIIARFIPFVRTFMPCAAGMAAMHYSRFFVFDVIGGALWVGGILYLSYWFGNIPIIKAHFSVVIFAIIGISMLPVLWEFIKTRTPFKIR
jgi:membrane-associated protein